MIISTLEIEKKIEDLLSNNDKKGALRLIIENALKAQQKTLSRLQEIRQYEKYKLVFIGNFGSGKTTAINYLFDLFYETSDDTKELLYTSGGRTTLCPVSIKPSPNDKSFFEVKFISPEELEKSVEDFCVLIQNRVDGDKAEKDSSMSSVDVPKEREIAIRNMAKLKNKTSAKTEDDAVVLYKEANNDFSTFKKKVLEKINVTVGQEKIVDDFVLEKSLNEETEILQEKKWIEKTYFKINTASKEGFSIPETFTIYISEKIYSQNKYFNQFEEIVDTRGIAKSALRKDLEKYIIQPNAICLFSTRFSQAPEKEIIEILNSYKDHDILFTERFFILALSRDNAHKAVKKDIFSGETAKTWEEGTELKRIEISENLNNENINFPENNILFYDAKRSFDSEKEKIEWNKPIKAKNFENDKYEVFKQIFRIIEKRRELSTELKELNANVEKISEGIDPKVEKHLIKTIKQLLNYQSLDKVVDFNIIYRRVYGKLHHMTMHAIHRRNGNFDPNAYDMAEYIIREMVKQLTNNYLNSINTKIERLKSEDAILEVVVEKLLNEISNNHIDFYMNIASDYKSEIQSNYFTSYFWDNLVEEFGKGYGYKNRVLDEIEDKLISLNSEIRNKIKLEWKRQVFVPILEFLGVNLNKTEEMSAKIDIVEIENYFGIEEIKIDNLSDKNEIYFLGENGHGKTIILQAIALALKGNDEGAVVDVLNDNEEIGKSVKTFVFGRNNGYLPFIFDENIKYNKKFNSVFAYGINRLRPEPKTDKETKDVHISLFTDDFNLYHPNRTIKSLNEHNHNLYNEFIKLLNNLLDNEIEIIPYEDKIKYKENELELSLYQLSHGYKSVIIWLSDLLYRLNKNQPEITSIKDYQGIVLIDEIGAYLHPRLKYTLIRKLREEDNLPNIQWFFTTHSPIITLGASPDAVFYKLYKDEKGITRTNPPVVGIENMTANSLITSLLWRVKSFASVKMQPEYISNDDYIYQKIHEVISKRIQDVPSLVDDDIMNMIENELNKLDEDESN